MKEILVATYKREDTYIGHSRINHYHIPVKFECFVCDNSDGRKMGILVNNEPVKDDFEIVTYNYQDDVIYRYRYDTRDEANKAVKGLIANYPDFKLVKA